MRYMMKNSSNLFVLVAMLACISLTTGCAASGKLSEPAAVPEVYPGYLAGYLQRSALPNSLFLLPPPPAEGSAALAYDEEVSRKALGLRDTPRWSLANEDANTMFPQAAGTFSCALNAPITEQDTPHLYMLLRRAMMDASNSTNLAKEHYKRTRPFAVNKEPICPRDVGKSYLKGGSFPSGHTATGWAWALILSEISPEQTDAILARGRTYGESRIICNVHWQNDVIAARFMASATVARLHADPTFRSDLEAAKAELAAVRAKGLKPLRDCAVEAAAMAQ
jgi:acid phosphatase (class A)